MMPSGAAYTAEHLKSQLPEPLLARAEAKATKENIPLTVYAENAGIYLTRSLIWRFCYATVLLIGLLNGISALPSGAMMMAAPDGSLLHMESFIPLFQSLPLADIFFKDLFWPGIALILVNGIPNLVTCFFILRRKRIGFPFAMVCGILLIIWTLAEIFWIKIPPQGSIVYLVLGVVQLASALYLTIMQNRQETLDVAKARDPEFTRRAIAIYSAPLAYRFMRGFIVLVCVGNALSAIPSAIRLAGDFGYTGTGIILGIVLLLAAGVPSALALPSLLKRQPKGYKWAIVVGLLFTVWSVVEVSVFNAYPAGWLEYLAQGSGSMNSAMGLLTAVFGLVLHFVGAKHPDRPVA